MTTPIRPFLALLGAVASFGANATYTIAQDFQYDEAHNLTNTTLTSTPRTGGTVINLGNLSNLIDEKRSQYVWAGQTRLSAKLQVERGACPGGNSNIPEVILYYHSDHLGGTQYLSDQCGGLAEHTEYLPNGLPWVDDQTTDPAVNNPSYFDPAIQYKFTGKELDSESGLYYYGARYFDPKAQVWLSPDPILDEYMGGSPNGGVFTASNLSLYSYVANNPVRYLDPDGRFFVVDDVAEAEAAAAAMRAATPYVLAGGAFIASRPLMIQLADAIGHAITGKGGDDKAKLPPVQVHPVAPSATPPTGGPEGDDGNKSKKPLARKLSPEGRNALDQLKLQLKENVDPEAAIKVRNSITQGARDEVADYYEGIGKANVEKFGAESDQVKLQIARARFVRGQTDAHPGSGNNVNPTDLR